VNFAVMTVQPAWIAGFQDLESSKIELEGYEGTNGVLEQTILRSSCKLFLGGIGRRKLE
jgi:hypothetical protein